jgi:hypothetical protein
MEEGPAWLMPTIRRKEHDAKNAKTDHERQTNLAHGFLISAYKGLHIPEIVGRRNSASDLN